MELIPIETINTACKRIIAWKLKYLLGDDKDHTVLIICLTIVGIIVVGIIIYLLLKFFVFKKDKQNNEIISGGDSNLL